MIFFYNIIIRGVTDCQMVEDYLDLESLGVKRKKGKKLKLVLDLVFDGYDRKRAYFMVYGEKNGKKKYYGWAKKYKDLLDKVEEVGRLVREKERKEGENIVVDDSISWDWVIWYCKRQLDKGVDEATAVKYLDIMVKALEKKKKMQDIDIDLDNL